MLYSPADRQMTFWVFGSQFDGVVVTPPPVKSDWIPIVVEWLYDLPT